MANGSSENGARTIFDRYDIADIEQYLHQIRDLIDKGLKDDGIAKQLPIEGISELIEISRARQENEKTTLKIYLNCEDLRFATNQQVAEWRAKRLACQNLVEIGAGIGLQTIAFAKTCKKVTAVEIDGRKTKYLEANLKLHGVTNVKVITGDCLAVVDGIEKADIVFCDPERAPSEETRSIETIQPHLPKVLRAFGRLTGNVAIELPPQIQHIPFDCEREYASVDGKLNRLTIYLGALKQAERSAVALPAGARLTGTPAETRKTSEPDAYLFEIDPATVAAGLQHLLPGTPWENDIGSFHTAIENKESSFFTHKYKVMAKCDGEEELAKSLTKLRCGRINYRAAVKPSEYWTKRARIEKKLKGKKEMTVFEMRDNWLVAEKI